MKNWRSVTLVVLALAGLSAAETAPASAPAPDEATARYEIDFMTGMIDHHAMAVEMAEICLQRATHAELIETCRSIRTTQSAEIARMQSWLEGWYGVDYKAKLSREQRAALRDLAALGGAEFEIAFMRQMIDHHQMAIFEAGTCLTEAYHQPLIGQCGAIASAQAREIVTMRQWLCEWYEACSLAAVASRPERSFG